MPTPIPPKPQASSKPQRPPMSQTPPKPVPQKPSPPPVRFSPQLTLTQAASSLVVALLILNAAGFLLLAIQFIAPKQQVAVVSTSGVNSKLDAVQAKLSSLQAMTNNLEASTGLSDDASVKIASLTDFQRNISAPDRVAEVMVDRNIHLPILRITSQPGDLFVPYGGLLEPTIREFTKGYRIQVIPISRAEYQNFSGGGAQPKSTVSANVQEWPEMCEAGCWGGVYSARQGDRYYQIFVDSNEYDAKKLEAVRDALFHLFD